MPARSPIRRPPATETMTTMTCDPGGLILHLEKVLHAPRERVFAAFVEPEQLAEWWGPAGFTTHSVDLDVRAGGRYRITMQPPDGEAFHLCGAYSEVDQPRRLVYTFEWEEPDPDDQVTVGDALAPRPSQGNEARARSAAICDRGATGAPRGGLDGNTRAARAVSGLGPVRATFPTVAQQRPSTRAEFCPRDSTPSARSTAGSRVNFLAASNVIRLIAKAARSWPSADSLRQLDDDPLRAADVAEPIEPPRHVPLEGHSPHSRAAGRRWPGSYFGRIFARSQTRGSDAASRSRTPGFDLRSAAKRSPSLAPR